MTSPQPSPGRPPQASVARAAFAGLCGGLLIGGVGLLVIGLRSLFGQANCVGLGEQECQLIVDAYTHVGRVQTICGGALISLSAALFVLARPYFSPRPPAAPQP
jgi:hypothetical protein